MNELELSAPIPNSFSLYASGGHEHLISIHRVTHYLVFGGPLFHFKCESVHACLLNSQFRIFEEKKDSDGILGFVIL